MSMIPVLVKRDFTSRVTGTAYIITTIVGVLVFVGLAFISPIMDLFASSFTPKNIDLLVFEQPSSTSFAPYLLQAGQEVNDFQISIVTGLSEVEAYRQVLAEKKTGLLLIDGPLYTLVTTDGSNMAVNSQIEHVINRATTKAQAERLGISNADMATLFQRVDLKVREIGSQGEDGTELDSLAHTQAMILAYFLLFMIYMALVMYGNMVASGVAEEKSSRIMEVMVATVSPFELMFGKIIGVGALGLLQFVIWIGTGVFMTLIGKQDALGGILGLSMIPLSTVLWFGLYFLLGYFFYASIFAAGGALVSRVEEVGQVVSLILMLIVVGFIAAFSSFTNPNSSFAVATSLIPFTSPMVMFARIVLANPPVSQIIASVSILIASVIGGTWLSAKIYRMGILLYGKRPSLREIALLLAEWK